MKENIKRGKKTGFSKEKTKKDSGRFIGGLSPGLIILSLYLLTEMVPRFDLVDVMGSQWFYLSLLNCITLIYLIKTGKFIPNRFFKSGLFILYSALLLICGLSFFNAYNVVESFVTYSRLLVTFIAFLNILSVLLRDSKVIRPLFLFIGLIAFYESLDVITMFFGHLSSARIIDDLIYNIKGNTGNKNILAASMVIKIPFLLYAIHQAGKSLKIFYGVILLSTIMALLILNARSAYVGMFLELIIYLALVTASYFKSERRISSFRIPGVVIGLVAVCIVGMQLLFATLGKQKKIGTYGGFAERIESISFNKRGTSERSMLWTNAVDYISKNPLFGGGYGNWKIHSCNYERFWQPGWGGCMSHVHNDFLEMCADTGIPGGIVYAGLFLVLFWYGFLIFRSPNVLYEQKIIMAAGVMSLAAYFVDSIFNFPLERPNIQILFALSAAIICYSYLVYKNNDAAVKQKTIHRRAMMALLLVSFATLYITWQVVVSMRIQYKISIEWNGLAHEAKIPFRSEDVNPYIPDIPNINTAGMPMACVKAKYLYQEKKYKEALDELNADSRSNPYLYYAEFLRSHIALSLNQKDSAYAIAKYAFYNRPANLQLHDYVSSMAIVRNDTMELEKAFKEVVLRRPSPDLWVKYSNNLFYCTNNDQKRMQVILDGLIKYPEDSALLYNKYLFEGEGHYKLKDYDSAITDFKEALMHQPGNPVCIENLGFCYINLQRYRDALPILSYLINNNASTTGKDEYFRAVCYHNLGIRDSSCMDFINAKSKGYAVNQELLEGCK